MPDVFNNMYLNMKLEIPIDEDGPDFSKVRKRLRDKGRLPIGRAHNNSILDTRIYELEYKDGQKYFLAANEIAENIFDQVNGEGNRHVLFQEIANHRYDGTAVTDQDVFITMRTGKKRRRETTKGVEVLVQWKDGSTTWVTLEDMNNSYPMHMAKYAIQLRIVGNPLFVWWIRNVLSKSNRIIGNLKSNYWVQTQKFGVNIPN